MSTFEFEAYRFVVNGERVFIQYNDDALHKWVWVADMHQPTARTGIRALMARVAALEAERDGLREALEKAIERIELVVGDFGHTRITDGEAEFIAELRALLAPKEATNVNQG